MKMVGAVPSQTRSKEQKQVKQERIREQQEQLKKERAETAKPMPKKHGGSKPSSSGAAGYFKMEVPTVTKKREPVKREPGWEHPTEDDYAVEKMGRSQTDEYAVEKMGRDETRGLASGHLDEASEDPFPTSASTRESVAVGKLVDDAIERLPCFLLKKSVHC